MEPVVLMVAAFALGGTLLDIADDLTERDVGEQRVSFHDIVSLSTRKRTDEPHGVNHSKPSSHDRNGLFRYQCERLAVGAHGSILRVEF